jgi:hypothetical protein
LVRRGLPLSYFVHQRKTAIYVKRVLAMTSRRLPMEPILDRQGPAELFPLAWWQSLCHEAFFRPGNDLGGATLQVS